MPEDDHGESNDKDRNETKLPDNTNPIGKPPETRPNSKEQYTPQARPHWADSVIAIMTVLIFFTYITSDFFLWKQLRLTENALTVSDKSLRLDKRAWVGVSPPAILYSL